MCLHIFKGNAFTKPQTHTRDRKSDKKYICKECSSEPLGQRIVDVKATSVWKKLPIIRFGSSQFVVKISLREVSLLNADINNLDISI